MYGIFIFLHLLVAVVLILVVLIQQPQKGGMASILGGGESIFGGGGAAPFMTKLTAGVAALFVVTSLTLVLLSAQQNRARTAPRPTPASTEQPATQPIAPAPQGE